MLEGPPAAEKARRDLAESESRLDTFRRQLADAAAKPPAAVQQQEKPLPPMIDNPEWLDLNSQLTDLQRRHDRLLVDRTPLHPAVQDAVMRIEDLKRRMAAIPQQVVGKQPENPATPDLGPPPNQIAPQDQAKLVEMTAAAQKARWVCDQAEAAEKQALQEQQAGPLYTVECAQVVTTPPPPDYGWQRLIWTTFVASVLMAFGVGSLSVGTNIEPPAASVADVQADANVAVVGTIPADDPASDPSMIHRQRRVRRTLIAIGLILIVVCPMVAIWGVNGI